MALYDHRGHGTSTLGAHRFTVGRLGADLRAVVEHFDLSGAVLAGHSIGGMALQAFAVEHPEVLRARTRGLVLVATSARPSPMPTTSLTMERVFGERSLRMPRGTIGHASVRGAFGAATPPVHHLEYVRQSIASSEPAARVGGAVAISEMDVRPQLDTVTVPTTVLAGSRDLLLPLYHARAIVRRVPDARLNVLHGAGHMLPMERPDEVAAAIEEMTAR